MKNRRLRLRWAQNLYYLFTVDLRQRDFRDFRTNGGVLYSEGRAIWWRECQGVWRSLWAGEDITRHRLENLIDHHYNDDILCSTILPYLKQQLRGAIYQTENGRLHSARIVENVIRANNVNVFPFPACSPESVPNKLPM